MNKRFSTLLAAALVAGGLFSANAQTPIENIKGFAEGEWTLNKNEDKVGLKLAEDHKLSAKRYVVISKDNFVFDGNGKTIEGRLVITGKNVTVKNLTLNYENTVSADVDGTITVNKTAITVIAPSVNLENVKVNCSVSDKAGNYLANGITVFPTIKNAKLNINGNTIVNANAEVGNWAASGIQIVEDYTLAGTGLDSKFMPKNAEGEVIETSATLAKTFDATAILEDNKYENCGTDFFYVVFNTTQINKTVQVTPLYAEDKTLLNDEAVKDFARYNFEKNASLIFKGTANQLSAALKDTEFTNAEAVIATKDGNVSLLAGYDKVINTDNVYYTINVTDKGLLSAAMDCVKDATISHEYLWSFGFVDDKETAPRFQNVESGKDLRLPNLDEANIFVVEGKENTYSYDGYEFTVAPVEFVKQEDSYLTIDDEDLRNETYNLGIYSPVWGGVSYFTENHGKPSHIIGLDPNALENGNVSEWAFTEVSKVKVTRTYYWYDATKDKNKLPKGWTKKENKFEIPAYKLTNQYNETLGWNEAEDKYAAKEDAQAFVFKKVGDYYNMVQLGEDKTSLLTSDVKVFGAHSAELGFLDQINVYNRTENDLVYISDPELTYDYRHLTADEKFVTFNEVNDPTMFLAEEGKFLISGNKCQDVKSIEMLAHAVWEPKTESGLAQYLLALDAVETENDTIWCNATEWHKHETLEDSLACEHTHIVRGGLAGRFLVNYVDSAKAFDANEDYHFPGYVNEYVKDGMYRLGFVDGVHVHGVDVKDKNGNLVNVEDTLIITDPEHKFLVENKNFNQAKFAFKYVEAVGSVHEDAPFVIETAFFNEEYKQDGTGFLRNINGIVVVTENEADATVFDLTPGEGGSTANEGVEVSEVKVIAGEGNVTIAGAAGKKVVVSNILGQVVANTVVASDNATIAAPAGVVVVAVEGEAAVKAIVK